MLELVISAIAGMLAVGFVWVGWNLYENVVLSGERKALLEKTTQTERDTEIEIT